MEEMMFMRLFGGGMFGSAIDTSAVLAFFVVGVVYMLIPVLGYQTERPRGFLVSLYVLILYGAISLVQLLAQWVLILGGNGGPGILGGRELFGHVLMLFSAAKIMVFLMAMMAFVSGLRGLRIYRLPPDA
jgi:hypothetical protein